MFTDIIRAGVAQVQLACLLNVSSHSTCFIFSTARTCGGDCRLGIVKFWHVLFGVWIRVACLVSVLWILSHLRLLVKLGHLATFVYLAVQVGNRPLDVGEILKVL